MRFDILGRGARFGCTSPPRAGVAVPPAQPVDVDRPRLEVIPLQALNPVGVANVLKRLISPPTAAAENEAAPPRVEADETTGRLSVWGSGAQIEQIEELIQQLSPARRPGEEARPDVGGGGSQEQPDLRIAANVKAYSLSSLDTNRVLQVVQELLANDSEVRFAIDSPSSSLILLARPEEHRTVETALVVLRVLDIEKRTR